MSQGKDISQEEVRFAKSNPALLGMVLLVASMCVLGWLMVNGQLDSRNNPNGRIVVYGWFGLLYFGAILPLAIRDLFTLPRWIIRFSPEGFIDHRYMREPVSWRNVRSVELKKTKRVWRLHIHLAEGVRPVRRLTVGDLDLARLRAPAQELTIPPLGIRATAEQLYDAACRFFSQARGKGVCRSGLAGGARAR
ncbi:MAG: hypothetical protein Q9M41_10890 [Paracoccaceae bacterium]|nr:hypothetical protein [Paracoccaceae bacterium]